MKISEEGICGWSGSYLGLETRFSSGVMLAAKAVI